MASRRALLVVMLIFGAILLIQASALYAHANTTYAASKQPTMSVLFGNDDAFAADNQKQGFSVQPTGFLTTNVQPTGFNG